MPTATGQLQTLVGGHITFSGKSDADGTPVSFVGTYSPQVNPQVNEYGATLTFTNIGDIGGSHTFTGNIGRDNITLTLDNKIVLSAFVSRGNNISVSGSGSGSVN